MVPLELKNLHNAEIFKSEIRNPANTLRKSNVKSYGYILVTYVSYFLLTLMLRNLNYVRNYGGSAYVNFVT